LFYCLLYFNLKIISVNIFICTLYLINGFVFKEHTYSEHFNDALKKENGAKDATVAGTNICSSMEETCRSEAQSIQIKELGMQSRAPTFINHHTILFHYPYHQQDRRSRNLQAIPAALPPRTSSAMETASSTTIGLSRPPRPTGRHTAGPHSSAAPDCNNSVGCG
jgi:hypothetical protein